MTDIQAYTTYYLYILLIGLTAWPLAAKSLSSFVDKGWIMSKTIGITLLTYFVWLLGIEKVLSFTRPHVLFICILITVAIWGVWLLKNGFSFTTVMDKSIRTLLTDLWNNQLLRVVIIEEIMFFALLGSWAYVRTYSPMIQGLEKFMDYGFMRSMLRAEYFPPVDHFFAAEPINYYYFGHLIAAVLTKLSNISSTITYNLQIAYLFAMTFMSSFSIGVTLVARSLQKRFGYLTFTGGLLSGVFTAVIGNLHAALHITEYKTYWYATATRLIPFTINEFPIYSFVVADLHGHVSNIPHALLIIALLIQMVTQVTSDKHQTTNKLQAPDNKKQTQSFVTWKLFLVPYSLLAFTIGVSYATNAWDFMIYLVLTGIVTLYFVWEHYKTISKKPITKDQRPIDYFSVLRSTFLLLLPLFILSILIMLPYWQTVKPISEGVGIVHDLSPIGLVLVLWGMYFFLAVSFVLFIFGKMMSKRLPKLLSAVSRQPASPVGRLSAIDIQLTTEDKLALLFMGTALLLIIIPEFIYVKDIYPQHYRANTMFKLYYAAWLMFSIATSYSFVRMVNTIKNTKKNTWWISNLLVQYILIAATLAYPYFAINSSTSSFKTLYGLDGIQFLYAQYPSDAQAITWLNEHIEGQPTIVEAVGESYTDYARISTFSGLPTVLGWPVHEWLWRGSYSDPVRPPSRVQVEYPGNDTVVQRVTDVQTIYTSTDQDQVHQLLNKYNVQYIYIGGLERQKYNDINEPLLISLGDIVYDQSGVVIIKYIY